jgi:Domain of unknown function (DUF4124)
MLAKRCWIAGMAWAVMWPLCASSEVYRWTDASGKVHFSDRAPDSRPRNVETVDVPKGTPKLDPERQDQRERGRKLMEVWEAERSAQAEADAATQQDRADIAARCAWIAKEIASIDRARLLYRAASDGNRQYMNDVERQQYVKELVDWRARNC